MTMLLTAFPMATVTMAEDTATTEDVKLFDAHITGNVVYGGTLTANFSPSLDDADIANLCPGLDVEKTKASIKWSARSRYGTTTNHNVTKYLAEGTLECVVPSDAATWKTYKGSSGQSNDYGIFFSITPTDASGNAIGDTVYSGVTAQPVAVDASANNKPVASGAYISALNGDGIIGVGKTVAARFALKYAENANVGESGSLYSWFTSDTYLDASSMDLATCVQEASTNPTYTIKPSDAGKWLYASITPVASDEEVGSVVYAKNHLGNILSVYGASASQTGFYIASGNGTSKYSNDKMLSDNDANTYFLPSSTSTTTNLTYTIDAGAVVAFDTIFLSTGTKSIKNFVLTYSSDNIVWNEISVDSYLNASSYLEQGNHEFDCGGLLSGRYFKITFNIVTADRNLRVQEFYPFLKNDAWFEGYTDSKIASFADNVITVETWDVPLADLHKKENGFTLKSDYDAEGTTTNADEIIANNISYVTKSVTSDGDVYTAIENPENVYVTEDTANTYMKVVGKNGVAQYFEINFDAKTTTSIEFTKSSFAQLNEDKIEVQAWGTPLAEVKKAENGFKVVSTLDAEGSTTNADAIANNVKFVTKNGDSYTEIADVDNIKVTENLENTYLKVDDGKVIQYYLVKYADNIYTTVDEVINSAVGGTSSTSNNARYIIGENGKLKLDDEGNTIGKYLLKTKINIPDGARTVIYARQGGVNASGANLNNILMLNGYTYTKYTDNNYYLGHQIAVPSLVKQTGYGFDRDEWLDLEMLFDYDSTSSGELSTINIKVWIDGILVSDDNHPWTNPVGLSTASASLLSPYIIMWPNSNTVKIQYKNSSFRQVWSADTHVVENDYDLMIVNSDAADVEATTLAAGSYTATTNMNVYKGSDLVTYIAKYYVNGDTKELMDVAYALSATKNYVTVTEDELANNTVELKAITFSYLTDSLYPQFVSKSLKSN